MEVEMEDSEVPASHVVGWAKGSVVVGRAGVQGLDVPEDYFCTVCAILSEGREPKSFQDLHLTKEQAVSLSSQLRAITE
jgi:hypothetical protein